MLAVEDVDTKQQMRQHWIQLLKGIRYGVRSFSELKEEQQKLSEMAYFEGEYAPYFLKNHDFLEPSDYPRLIHACFLNPFVTLTPELSELRKDLFPKMSRLGIVALLTSPFSRDEDSALLIEQFHRSTESPALAVVQLCHAFDEGIGISQEKAQHILALLASIAAAPGGREYFTKENLQALENALLQRAFIKTSRPYMQESSELIEFLDSWSPVEASIAQLLLKLNAPVSQAGNSALSFMVFDQMAQAPTPESRQMLAQLLWENVETLTDAQKEQFASIAVPAKELMTLTPEELIARMLRNTAEDQALFKSFPREQAEILLQKIHKEMQTEDLLSDQNLRLYILLATPGSCFKALNKQAGSPADFKKKILDIHEKMVTCLSDVPLTLTEERQALAKRLQGMGILEGPLSAEGTALAGLKEAVLSILMEIGQQEKARVEAEKNALREAEAARLAAERAARSRPLWGPMHPVVAQVRAVVDQVNPASVLRGVSKEETSAERDLMQLEMIAFIGKLSSLHPIRILLCAQLLCQGSNMSQLFDDEKHTKMKALFVETEGALRAQGLKWGHVFVMDMDSTSESDCHL